MPLTPFHLGPQLTFSVPFRKYIDPFVFLVAGLSNDIEPLVIAISRKFSMHLGYPMHGYLHTFTFGTVFALLVSLILFARKDLYLKLMDALHIQYTATLVKALLSGVLGFWLHLLFDMPLYEDLKPFAPFTDLNPLYNIFPFGVGYIIAILFLFPAFLFVLIAVISYTKD
jgi:hypothetical protein